ncbi:hypothetical protein [Paenibacillus sp. NPDC058071]|uniref:hypothetical protein n=1 Tax=Paenibacillus sp. NPDC058071 TaxID=3346326 RepID=UPI0036DD2F5C
MDKYSELSTVESQRNELVPEEFPEGPAGSSLSSDTLGKSGPWQDGQKRIKRFSYENRSLHDGLLRDYPGDDDDLSLPDAMDEP